jgi:pimeloyl-ACP methyl ester carboxylesterase
VSQTRSADGTIIAYERLGDHDRGRTPLIVVGGALCDRQRMLRISNALAQQLPVVNYDRRARGDSGSGGEVAVEAEVEDLAALAADVGDPVSLYGHSSGAALALQAALHGLPITRLVLHDPSYAPAGDRARRRAYHQQLTALVSQGRLGDAVALFMTLTGMPSEAIDAMRAEPSWPAIEPLGRSLPYDSAALDDAHGGGVPAGLERVTTPTLVLVGGANPPFFLQVARELANGLPNAGLHTLEDEGHVADAGKIAPIVVSFMAG